MPTPPPVSALNHLLAQNPWVPPRLARFSGRTVHVSLAPFSFACTILEDGMLESAAHSTSADVVCSASPAILPRLALHDESALALLDVSGEAALAEEILFLARNVRWDAAEDLSRFTGDIAAERLVQLAEAATEQVRQVAASLSGALAEYLTEESPLVAKPRQIDAFAEGVAELRASIEALERRIEQVSKAR